MRMSKRSIILVVVLVSGCLVLGCLVLGVAGMRFLGQRQHVDAADIPGTYHGSWGDYKDVLVLHADGTFLEHYTDKDGTTYDASGKWRAVTANGHLEVILDSAYFFSPGPRPFRLEWELRVVRDTISRDISLINARGEPEDSMWLTKSD